MPPRSVLLERISMAGAEQHGVVSRDQLLDTGLDPRSISRWVGDGTLHKVGRWAYARVPPPLPWTGRLWAAMLSAPSDGHLGFLTAGERIGMNRIPSGPIWIVVPDSRQPRKQPGIRVHQTNWLPESDLVVIDGLRCTSPARTLIDAASAIRPPDLDDMLDQLIKLRRYDGVALARVIDERPDWPGAAPLGAAIGRLDAAIESNRSKLERMLFDLITASDLPPAVNNAMIVGEECDFSWIGSRVIVEADGRAHHQSPADIAADIAKWEALRAAGYIVVRVTYAQVAYEPEATIERIRKMLLRYPGPPVPQGRR